MERNGLFAASGESRWRQQRLLVLCYHGVALDDEHEWDPEYYVTPAFLRRRLEILREEDCHVLPLGDALDRMGRGTLPPRSVALTFDDGMHDFQARAWPLLREAAYSATVYLTSFYSIHQTPVFDVFQGYLLWRARGQVLDGRRVGLDVELDLRNTLGRRTASAAIKAFAARHSIGTVGKQALLERLASELGVDYAQVASRRLLHIMTPAEVEQVCREGAAVELHTHRHRLPDKEALFREEIEENRRVIHQITGREPMHLCYPSGVFATRWLPWLTDLGVVSGTTCVPGYAHSRTEPLLLPRFVDTGHVSELEFRGWISGAMRFVGARRGPVRQTAKSPQAKRR
jgi:peptidoglycan/xylan/chitin deacetylase (PgdA/CDA1 family)